jgi:murein DD-endopeptidase MepM/ murein hydrolase activator NlpD
MRLRASALAAAALAAAALAGQAGAQTFTLVGNPSKGLPSAKTPNAPGSIAVPYPLSKPPARPAVLSYDELLGLWRRAGDAYGVPWQVLGAINKIESNFGSNMGPSSAGALGWMQFIPSSWMRWGMDGDGNGLADPWDPQDAVFSAARYLAAAGAQQDLARAIFAYNHADWYVEDVLELAELLGGDGSALRGFAPAAGADVFLLADLKERLAAARRRVTAARQALPGAEDRAQTFDWRLLALEQRAGDPSLSDRQFRRLEARIARASAEQNDAREALERAHAELDYSVAALDELRSQAAAATALSSQAGSYIGGTEAIEGYVFPVGGGPGRVSVAHDHHDYPAADIAAPEGSPVFALANALVVESYPTGKGKCGLGLKLQLESGAVYVYCHLAYLEEGVTPGAAVAAGAPLGLVGQTGNATGPHLHLGLDPALSFPQEEPWFQAFAGRAFSWQDAPTPKPAAARPAKRVFRVASEPVVTFGMSIITFTR